MKKKTASPPRSTSPAPARAPAPAPANEPPSSPEPAAAAKGAEASRLRRAHAILNGLTLMALAAVVVAFGDPSWRSLHRWSVDIAGVDWSKFPDHYTPVFDFVTRR